MISNNKTKDFVLSVTSYNNVINILCSNDLVWRHCGDGSFMVEFKFIILITETKDPIKNNLSHCQSREIISLCGHYDSLLWYTFIVFRISNLRSTAVSTAKKWTSASAVRRAAAFPSKISDYIIIIIHSRLTRGVRCI